MGGARLEVQREVADGAQTHGARVAVQRVLREARGVHEVAAGELLDGSGARKEVVGANGAVGVERALAARVLLVQLQRHAGVAGHAVEGVAAEARAAAAHVAEWAVVDLLACSALGIVGAVPGSIIVHLEMVEPCTSGAR